MLGQQTEETKENFLDALGETVLSDAVLLDGGEVGEEKVEEHAQAVVGKRESHLLIVNHHLHQFAQAAKVISLQRQHGRGKFYHREVGRADGVAHCGQTEREMLVAQQADAAVVAGGREDSDLQPPVKPSTACASSYAIIPPSIVAPTPHRAMRTWRPSA